MKMKYYEGTDSLYIDLSGNPSAERITRDLPVLADPKVQSRGQKASSATNSHPELQAANDQVLPCCSRIKGAADAGAVAVAAPMAAPVCDPRPE